MWVQCRGGKCRAHGRAVEESRWRGGRSVSEFLAAPGRGPRDHKCGGTHGLPACTEIKTWRGAQPQGGGLPGQAAQKRQGQTAKEKQCLSKHNSHLRSMTPICSAQQKYVVVCMHEGVHMCMCVRACACVCMHVHLCGRMRACFCVHVRGVCACACVHVRVCCTCVCTCMRFHTRVPVCVRGQAHACQSTCVSVHARSYASCACAYVFSRRCACAYVYVPS